MCSLSIKTNLNKNKNVFTPLGEPVFSPPEQFSAFFNLPLRIFSLLTVISLVEYTLAYFPITCLLVSHLSTDL